MKNFKLKMLVMAGLALGSQPAFAYHNFFFRSATDITFGTLPNARLDSSSVTLQGNTISISTTASGLQSLASFVATDTTTLANRPASIALYDEGSLVAGGMTSVNCTGANIACSGSSSTGTITISGSAGSTGQSPYTVIVGTVGAPGVDFTITNLADFNAALARIGACGLTYSSTATGTMFMKDGTYEIPGATVPAGVKIIAGSSVVWSNTNENLSILTNYGWVDGVKFSGNGRAIASKWIAPKSNSKLTNFLIFNATGQARSPGQTYIYSLIGLDGATNTVTQGEIRDFNVPTIISRQGDQAVFSIRNSTDSDISLTVGSNSISGTNNGCFFYLQNTGKTVIHDSKFIGMQSPLFDFEKGVNDFSFVRNFIRQIYAPPTGIINFNDQFAGAGPFHSTGTLLFMDNTVEIGVNGGSSVFFFNNAGGIWDGGRIKNNVIYSDRFTTLGNWTFATIGAGAKGWIFQGNNITGVNTFIADSGTMTLYVSQGNTLSNVEQ